MNLIDLLGVWDDLVEIIPISPYEEHTVSDYLLW